MNARMKMKIWGDIAILAIATAVLLAGFCGMARAEDQMIESTIVSVTEALDKNGNPYVRFIVNQTRELNGVKYEKGVPVMAFGSTIDLEAARQYGKGDLLKAVASYDASYDSYTVLAFVE